MAQEKRPNNCGHCFFFAKWRRKDGAYHSLEAEAAAFLRTSIPLDYHELSEVGIVGSMPQPTGNGRIVIACAGTSDLPVAEEAP